MTKINKKSPQTTLLLLLCFCLNLNTIWAQNFLLIDTIDAPYGAFLVDIRKNEINSNTCDFVPEAEAEVASLVHGFVASADFTFTPLISSGTFYFSNADYDILENGRLAAAFFTPVSNQNSPIENTFFDPAPQGISIDYNNQLCVVGQGVTTIDPEDYTGTNTFERIYNMIYLQDLPLNFRAKGQMTFREGSFYYPSVSNELIQLKIRGEGSFVYRSLGSLPDTINYGGFFSIPYSCDSTTTYLIDRRPETGSTMYIVSIPDVVLTEHCQLPQKSISAAFDGENALPPCDFTFDLNTLNDTTFNRYDTICSGSVDLLDDNLLLVTDLEFDSLVIQNTNALDGTNEWLDISTTHPEITVANNQSNRIVLESTGFAKGSYFLEVLQSLSYTNSLVAPTTGLRDIKVQVFHSFYDSLEAHVFLDVSVGTLQVTIEIEQPSCFDSADASIRLFSNGGVVPVMLTWEDDNNAGFERNNLASGDYIWQLIDGEACALMDTVSIVNPDTLNTLISSVQDTICGDNGSLFSIVEGGTFPYSFVWSNNATDSTLTQLTAGQYLLTVTDANDCEAINSYTLIALDTVYASAIVESCQGQTLMINARSYTQDTSFQQLLTTVEGCDSLVDYQLVFQDTFYNINTHTLCFGQSIDINGLPFSNDTIVYLTQQSVSGCDSTLQYNINILPENIQPLSADICLGETYDFNGQLLTQNGVYNENLTAASGCDSIIQLQLNVHNPQPVINTQGRLCANDNMTLSTSVYSDYLWSTGAISSEISINTANDYSLIVHDEYGCVGTAMITIQDTTLDVMYQVHQPLCLEEGGRISFEAFFGGTAPYFLVQNGMQIDSSSLIEDLSEGLHIFIIQDADGCETAIEATIIAALNLEASLPEILNIAQGESILLDLRPSFAPTAIFWTPDIDLSCNDCLTPIASPKETTTYQVNLQNGEGCLWQGNIMLVVKRNGLYIPNVFSPNGDGSNDFFTLYPSTSVQTINRIEVFDRWGALVFKSNDMTIRWDGMIAGQKAAQAVYLYQIEWTDWNNEVVLEKGELILLR